MSKAIGLLSICPILAIAQPVDAQTLCGEPYRVQPLDTLSDLAVRAFGSADRFLDFYNDPANAKVLSNNPNRLQVGWVIQMPPCAAETSQPVSSGTAAAARERPAPSDGFAFHPEIQLVTATNYAPFTDLEAPNRGMITQVVAAALDASDLPNEFRIDFINDWGSHLNILLPSGKYDFGFPWFKPDCTKPAELPEADQIRCRFAWSEPLYTVPIGFYRIADGSPEPQSFDDLFGLRICRPTGYFIFDLAEVGLTEKTIELVQPDSPDACVTALERDEVDYISLNRFTMDKAIARAKLKDVVVPIQTLLTTQALHLVAHGDYPTAAFDWMNGFNEGLKRIQASQDRIYNRIVNDHIRYHNEAVAKLEAEPLE